MVDYLLKWEKSVYRWNRLKKALNELVFSPRCCLCNIHLSMDESGLCPDCQGGISLIERPFCRICSEEFDLSQGEDHLCGKCIRKPPPFTMARAVAAYDGTVRALLLRLKYNFDTATLSPLYQIVRSFDFSGFEDSDIIIPVPLHLKRLKKRGMNQSLILARLFFPEVRNIIHPTILVRVKDTPVLSGLDLKERKKNIRAAFYIQNSEMIREKVVTLVDDIYTTGTTVKGCAMAIKAAGGKEVKVITMAKVRKKSL